MDLQDIIRSQSLNGRIELPPGEFFGQITIDRPLTIIGRGLSSWIGSRNGPTVLITASGVRLQNLMIENTAGSNQVAVEAIAGIAPVLERVEVRGRVVGVPPENIRDKVNEDLDLPTRISFLPPPPISVGALKNPAAQPTPLFTSPLPVGADPNSTIAAAENAQERTSASVATSQITSQFGDWLKSHTGLSLWKASMIFLWAVTAGATGLYYVDQATRFHILIDQETRAKEGAQTVAEQLRRQAKDLSRQRDLAQANFDEQIRKYLKVLDESEKVRRENKELVARLQQLERSSHRAGGTAQVLSGRDWGALRGEAYSASSPEMLRALADGGNAVAQYRIGMFYLLGHKFMDQYFPRDKTVALRWLRDAAKQGYPEAQTVLKDAGEHR